jgi:uncharacterized membrane protein HdeD (DUF308 family)
MPIRLADLPSEVPDALSVHWGWVIALGILIGVLGIWAILRAQTATTLAVGFFGVITVVSGVSVLLFSFLAGGYWTDFLIHTIWAALILLAGIIMLTRPLIGAQALTILIAVYFLAEGAAIVGFALSTKVEDLWSHLTQGLMAFLLGGLLIIGWPITGLWAIGTFIGVDLLIKSWMLIALGLGLRKISEGSLF